MTEMQLEHRAISRWQSIDWYFNTWFSYIYAFLLTASWGKRHRKVLPHIRGPRVLEVSFGVGFLMSLYAADHEVTGLDYNPHCVEAARRRLGRMKLNATLVEGDAHALPFPDGSFDTVINTDAFTVYRDPEQALREHFRVLAPGGRLILMEQDHPKDRNLLGRFWAFASFQIMMMPHLDLVALHENAGFPYESHDVGGAGVLQMYVSNKPSQVIDVPSRG